MPLLQADFVDRGAAELAHGLDEQIDDEVVVLGPSAVARVSPPQIGERGGVGGVD